MKKSSAVITGAISMVVTALLFILLSDDFLRLPMCWLCFAAVLILEFVTTALLACSAGRPRRVAAATGFLIASVVMIAVSVLFINLLPFSYFWYLAVLILTSGLAAAAAVPLWSHDSRQEMLESSRAYFKSCRDAVMALRNSSAGKAHEDALRRLEEDLRYADDTKFTELDGGIRERLTALSGKLEDPAYDPEEDLAYLKDLIKQRQCLLHN